MLAKMVTDKEIIVYGYIDAQSEYHGDYAISMYETDSIGDILEQYPPHCFIEEDKTYVSASVSFASSIAWPTVENLPSDPQCNPDFLL